MFNRNLFRARVIEKGLQLSDIATQNGLRYAYPNQICDCRQHQRDRRQFQTTRKSRLRSR